MPTSTLLKFPRRLCLALLLIGAHLAPIALAAPPSCVSSPEDGRTFPGILYAIKGPTTTISYVFGTMHQGHRDVRVLPPSVASALAHSKTFYRESQAGTREEMLKNFNNYRFLPEGKTLSTTLDQATYARYQHHLDLLQLAAPSRLAMERLNPIAALGFVEQLPVEFDNSPSLDDLLDAAARSAKIPIDGLETQQEAMGWLQSVSDPDWNMFANEALDMALCYECIHKKTELLACTAQLVRAGEADRISLMYDAYYQHLPGHAALLQKSVFSRNARMAEKIAILLRKDASFFVSIGAGHLGGSVGVIDRLRKMGFVVEQIK